MKDSEEDRRAGFVESLLNAHHSGSSTSGDVVDYSLPEKFQKLQVEGNKNSSLAGFDPLDESMLFHLPFFVFYLISCLVGACLGNILMDN